MTEQQGGTGEAARPGDGLAAERVVIRDRRRVDASGGRAKHAAEPAEDDAVEPAAATTGAEPAADATDEGAPAPDGAADDDTTNGGATNGGAAGADAAEAGAPAESGAGEPETPAVSEPTAGTGDAGTPAPQPVDSPAPAVEEDAPAGDAAPTPESELAAVRAELAERTRDLQRVTAEYANYRKRVDRDRGLAAEQTTGAVLSALLPVLDDLDRAREHGDLVGPFGSVAEQLTAALGKFGLTPFGDKGDAFDPTRHEAVAHLTSAEVTEPTCVDVMRRGYLLGERLLRPALVAVADPQ